MAKKNTRHFVCGNLILAVIIGILLIGGTTAYLLSTNTLQNMFTIAGNNTSTLEEVFNPALNSGTTMNIEKKVWVKNTGDSACYVRVLAEITDPNIRERVESIDFNTTDWTEKQDDGYYYYKKKIESGKKTKPLFTTIKLSEPVNPKNEELEMICYSETISSSADSPIEAFAQGGGK